MGVVERRAENLAAGQVLEGRGNAAFDMSMPLVSTGTAVAEARQGGAKGAQQKYGLDHVAACLLDRERREVRIVQRSFRHDTGDREGSAARGSGRWRVPAHQDHRAASWRASRGRPRLPSRRL